MGQGARTAALLALGAALMVTACGDDSDGDPEVSGALPPKTGILFVLRGEASIEESRLEIKTDTVEWFTDRPERRAGVAEVESLAEQWGTFGFDRDAPNAAVTGGDVNAVGVLTDPNADQGRISFAFKPIRGSIEEAHEEDLSVFIDSTGIEAELDQLQPGQEVEIVLDDGTTVDGDYAGMPQKRTIAVITSDGDQALIPIRKIEAVIVK